MTPVSPIRPVTMVEPPSAAPRTESAGGFQSLLESYVGQVSRVQDAAQNSVNSFLAGGTEELHSVALATQRAELEFEMFLQVRNKVVQAYQEIMRMQI